MKGSLRGRDVRKLNTQGCCFLCLEPNTIKLEINGEVDETVSELIRKETSMRCLTRYLQVNLDEMEEATSSAAMYKARTKPEMDVKVDLCESCEKLTSEFSSFFQQLEKVRMELNYTLKSIHKCISQSAKSPDLVHNFSNRMTSDLEASSQLAFANNLRNEVAKKCLKKMNVPGLQVIVTRADNKLITTEYTEISCERDDWDFPGNVDSAGEIILPDLASSPPSPNSPEDHEEELQPEFTDTETPSQSPKPLKPRAKKSKYFTKHPSTGMLKCRNCDKTSKSPCTIFQHFQTVHLQLRFTCDICNVSVFSLKSLLKKHKETCWKNLEKKLAKEKDPRFKFICKICGKRFDENLKLWSHTWGVHENVGRYKCDLCDKKYTSSTSLKRHQAATHKASGSNVKDVEGALDSTSPAPKSSSLTEKELSSSLKPPVKQKGKNYTKQASSGMYKCNKCDKESIYRSTINDHYNRIHLKRKFKCDICNVSSFGRPRDLKVHKETCAQKVVMELAKEQDPKFKFICKVCGKRFDKNRKLVHHTKWVHENVDRFQCDLCDKKYTSMHMLKNHQAVIHQSRKLYCKICNKMYKDIGKFRQHEKKCEDMVKIKVESVEGNAIDLGIYSKF